MPDEEELIKFVFFMDEEIVPHSHRDIEIVYVLEGSLCLQVENDQFEMHEEDFILVNTCRQHSFFSKDGFLAVSFYINYQMISALMQTGNVLFWCNSLEGENREQDEIRQLFRKILKQYFNVDKVRTNIYLTSLYYQLLYILIPDYVVYLDKTRSETHIGKKEARLQEIENYIQTNYQRPLTLDEMAKHVYMSPGYLSKYIRKNMNMSFTEYVSSIRLFHAVEDLLYTDKSITKIIYDNGFPNASAFNKLFRKRYLMSPSDYRAKKKPDSEREDLNKKKQTVPASRIRSYFARYNSLDETGNEKKSLVLKASQREGKTFAEEVERVINIGSIEDLLDAKMREHVLVLCRELNYTHVRVWNIFPDSIARLELEGGTEEFNFIEIDKALDFLVENKISAYLAFEDKTKILISDPIKQFDLDAQEANSMEYSYRLFFFQCFAKHLVNRYGISEIEKWIFEFSWPKDNNGILCEEYFDPQYYENFSNIYRIFKQFSNKIRVGGFSLLFEGNKESLERIIERWEDQEVWPDFISFHCFPYYLRTINGRNYVARSTDESHIFHQICQIQNLLKNTKLSDCPIYVSEWGSTLSNRSALNDGSFKGAYIMKNLLECHNTAQIMAYWIGSDLYGVKPDRNGVCFGDSGLLTKDGCRKPAFFGMKFVNSLYENFVLKSDYAAITFNGQDKYRIICHNFCHFGYKFYTLDEDKQYDVDMNELFEDYDEIVIHFQIQDVKSGSYRMQMQYVNFENGSIQNELNKIGDLEEPNSSELKYLQRVCAPHMKVVNIEAKDGTLQFESLLKPNEIQLIELDYQYTI